MSQRDSQQKLKTVNPIDPRDTFDYTTPNLVVGSNPVDPYAAPAMGQVNPQLKQLADSLNGINQALGAYGASQQFNKKENTDAAAAAAMLSKKNADAKSTWLKDIVEPDFTGKSQAYIGK